MTPDSPHLGPIRQVPAHELVIEQLRLTLETGQFRPGDRLPPERQLAEVLDVARNTLRAAMASLEQEGVLAVARGRGGGYTVLEPKYDLRAMRRRLSRNRVAMTSAFDFRVVVETGAARLAAERHKAADLEPLDSLVGQMSATIERSRLADDGTLLHEFHLLDNAFHLGVARASRNEHLVAAVAEGRRRMWLPMGALFGHLPDDSNDDHADILDAVQERDAERAAAVMAHHINRTKETFETWLSQ